MAIALVGASAWLWRHLGRQAEGQAWLERALQLVDEATPAAREARLHYAFLELSRSRTIGAERLVAHADRALALYRRLGDPVRTCLTLAHQALQYAAMGDAARAATALAEADAAFDPQWAPLLKRPLLTARGIVHYEAGRTDLARAAWAERLAIERQLGEREMEMAALINLVDIDFVDGNLQAAIDGGRELVAAIRRDRVRSWESFALGNLSAALTAAGQIDEALQLAREALPLLAGQGATASFLDTSDCWHSSAGASKWPRRCSVASRRPMRAAASDEGPPSRSRTRRYALRSRTACRPSDSRRCARRVARCRATPLRASHSREPLVIPSRRRGISRGSVRFLVSGSE